MVKNVPRKPTLLIILDGFGLNPSTENNAVAMADTPNLDYYFANYPTVPLQASGRAVGLPGNQMGNSEVGHMIIGAGNILRQDLVRIDDSIAEGSFYRNPVLLNAARKAKQNNRPLHLVGLVSDGGVHSHINHLLSLIELCRQEEVSPTLHMITDGRDTPPQSALAYMDALETALADAGGNISTVAGRFYAMDRDKRWDRTEKAWRAMSFGEGQQASSAREAIEQAYARGQTDEFILPTVIRGNHCLDHDDQVVFFNFRNDRARQMTYLLAGENFAPFDRGSFRPCKVTCLTEYDPKLELPIAFAPEFPEATLSSVISEAGIAQLHCAETEKYAHVTFFLSGGKETPYPGEDRVMIPSPNVNTYDEAPEMSAAQVADEVIKGMRSERYGFIVVNFANGDMVGHTAVQEAVVRAVEAMDKEVGRVLSVAAEEAYSVLLTADHGNCELMVDPLTHVPHTQHTSFPVPCMLIDNDPWTLEKDAGLSNIAPTILELMGLPKPASMTAKSLLSTRDRKEDGRHAAA